MENWYAMQIKTDMINSLQAYGRLPQPTIQAYFDELALSAQHNESPNSQSGSEKIQLHKLREELAGAQQENGRLQKEREQMLNFIKAQGLHEKLNEASETIF